MAATVLEVVTKNLPPLKRVLPKFVQPFENGPCVIIPPNHWRAVNHKIDIYRGVPGLQVVDLGEVAPPKSIRTYPMWAISKKDWGRTRPRLRILITAGVHGDEPEGPSAAFFFLDRLLLARDYLPHPAPFFSPSSPFARQELAITVVPVINPTGYKAGLRYNYDNINLNRTFVAADTSSQQETKLLRPVLEQPFDLVLDLHASLHADGFFVIPSSPLFGVAALTEIMARFARRHPVLKQSDYYDYVAPGVFSSRNRGTFKEAARQRGADWTFTLEAPGMRQTFEERVRGLEFLIHEIISAYLHFRAFNLYSRGEDVD
eukprot:g69484.t1